MGLISDLVLVRNCFAEDLPTGFSEAYWFANSWLVTGLLVILSYYEENQN